jgi:excisionase family DNA binding protein
MDNTSESSYLRPAQLSQRWGFHAESVRRMIRQGRLPAVRIGKRLLISQTEVDAFEANHRLSPSTPAKR